MPTKPDAALAPHLALSTPARTEPAPLLAPEFTLQGKLWRPRRVLITPDTLALPRPDDAGACRRLRGAGYPAE